MVQMVDPKVCSCNNNSDSDACLWQLLHRDLREISTKSTYRGVTVGNLMANELSTRAGQRKTKENLLLDQEALSVKVFDELKKYTEILSTKLLAKVYSDKDKKLINIVRVLLDLETLAIRLKLSGSAFVAALQSRIFVENARIVAPQLPEISD